MRRAAVTALVALAATVWPSLASAEGCAPPPPGNSDYSSPSVATPEGDARARGGPDHAGATVGKSYVFADGDTEGVTVYGAAAKKVKNPGGYGYLYGPEYRVSISPDGGVDACAEEHRP